MLIYYFSILLLYIIYHYTTLRAALRTVINTVYLSYRKLTIILAKRYVIIISGGV